MADKLALLENAKLKGWKYPTSAINWAYTLCGCYFGGVIFHLIYHLGIVLLEHPAFNPEGLAKELASSFFSGFLGIILGFIPALCTGIAVSGQEFIIEKSSDYLKLLYIGLGMSGFCASFALVFANKQAFVFAVAYTLAGGLASVICGKLFVPKLNELT